MHTEMKRRRIYLFLVHVHFSGPRGASWQRNKLLQAISTHRLIDDLPITIVPFVVDAHMVTCRAYILLTSMTLPCEQALHHGKATPNDTTAQVTTRSSLHMFNVCMVECLLFAALVLHVSIARLEFSFVRTEHTVYGR
jgi:hypothetical protein